MSLRQRLLDTPVEKVPPELAAAVKAFCEPIPEIQAAYIGLVEVTRDFDFPQEQLAAAFELAEPSVETPEGDRELHLVADKFYDELPETIQAGGCNFLGADALPVWNEKAWQVFSR
jgi:hypothetical protein